MVEPGRTSRPAQTSQTGRRASQAASAPAARSKVQPSARTPCARTAHRLRIQTESQHLPQSDTRDPASPVNDAEQRQPARRRQTEITFAKRWLGSPQSGAWAEKIRA